MLTYCIAYDNGIWYLIRCSSSLLVVSLSVGFMHDDDCLMVVHVCLCHSVAVYLLRGCISVEWPSWPNGCQVPDRMTHLKLAQNSLTLFQLDRRMLC